jgi:hypothetical protein
MGPTSLRSRNLLSGLALAAVLAGLPLASGCVIRGRGAVVVDTAPPPPRYVEVEVRPGYIWMDGYWAYRGANWVWVDGYYERERPGYVHVRGRWVRRGGRWHWVEPRWQRGRAKVRVHDHRSGPRGPEVHDHRSGGKKGGRGHKKHDHR